MYSVTLCGTIASYNVVESLNVTVWPRYTLMREASLSVPNKVLPLPVPPTTQEYSEWLGLECLSEVFEESSPSHVKVTSTPSYKY